ncbi:MAG: SpoIIE family protein phosphatase [Lachnospiraceae bacterium]|nr:SpoIIE family protein phosphatase [Lachnospiraceae bacterium]
MEGQYRSGELERWTARAAESYQELARVFSSYVTDKKIEEQELSLKQPDGCGGSCSACAQLARTKQSAYNQMLEGKEALVYQLEETARYFRQMEHSIKQEQYLTEEKMRELLFYLRRYHIKGREIETFYRPGKGRELAVRLRCDSMRKTMSMRLVERLLSEQLGFPVKAAACSRSYLSEEEQELVFREMPGYYGITGVARMKKEEQKVSGDSFSFFYEEEGEMAMILSDGMGSGEKAAKESESVLLLLERMLAAGFKEETAIRLINSVLALRAEQNMFATLDISRINLYSGTCEFIKIGGAATYLRRGKWLECVEAKTLPIGMVQKVDYDFLVKKLYDGDYIIMMSDGVLDMVPEEKRADFLQQIIGEDPGQNPQVIAGRILNASLLVQNFEPKDDMTVLVCGIFQQK